MRPTVITVREFRAKEFLVHLGWLLRLRRGVQEVYFYSPGALECVVRMRTRAQAAKLAADVDALFIDEDSPGHPFIETRVDSCEVRLGFGKHPDDLDHACRWNYDADDGTNSAADEGG